MPDCKDLVSFSGLIFAAFEIVDKEANNFDELLLETLKSPHFEKSLRKALEAQAKKFMADNRRSNGAAASDSSLSGEDATKVLTTIANSTLKGSLKAAEERLKNSSGVKKLERDVKQFGNQLQCSFQNTPMGVWVSENKKWLVVVGTVAAVGAALCGAAIMYRYREGDGFAKLAVKTIPEFEAKILGTIILKASVTNFTPTEHKVGVKLGGEVKWNKVKVSLDISGIAVEKSVDLGAKVKVVIPIDKKTTVIGSAGAKTTKLSLGGQVAPSEIDMQLNLTVKHEGNGFAVQLGAMMGMKSQANASPDVSYGITGTLSIPF